MNCNYIPYGIPEYEKEKTKESCEQCYKRIEKRIDELDKDYHKIRRVITSPIYGEIPIDNIANILIDTCYMQRLRRVKHLSFNNLIFPSANHNRFEHSLGTYYLACKICENNYFKEKLSDLEEKLPFKIAALLHDISHGPFSHMTDDLCKILNPKKNNNHEKRGRWLIRNNSIYSKCIKNILQKIWEKLNKDDNNSGSSSFQVCDLDIAKFKNEFKIKKYVLIKEFLQNHGTNISTITAEQLKDIFNGLIYITNLTHLLNKNKGLSKGLSEVQTRKLIIKNKQKLVKIFPLTLNKPISKKQFSRIITHAIIGKDPGEGYDPGKGSSKRLDVNAISILLNGPVDVDKLDYMVRDAYYTGVPFGASVDVNKICQNIYTERDGQGGTNNQESRKIIIKSRVVPSVFNLFSSRFAAYKSAIYHHVPLIAQEMMLRELVPFFKKKENKNKKLNQYIYYDDRTFLSELEKEPKNNGVSKAIFEVENRLLFKRVFCFDLNGATIVKCFKKFDKRRKYEKELEEKNGVNKKNVLIVLLPKVEFYPEKVNRLYVEYPGRKLKYNKVLKNLNKVHTKAEVMICLRNKNGIINKENIKKIENFYNSKFNGKIMCTYRKEIRED